MAITLPDFTALPQITPQAGGNLPQYPANDAGAVALGELGKGVTAAGGALVDVAAYKDIAQTKMDKASADADFANATIPITHQLTIETDPEKITVLRGQYQAALEQAGQNFSNPLAREYWMKGHARTVAEGAAAADLRNSLIYRDKYNAGLEAKKTTAVNNGTDPTDSAAFDIGMHLIDRLSEASVLNGTSETAALEHSTKAKQELILGRADRMDAAGNPQGATAFLQQYGGENQYGVQVPGNILDERIVRYREHNKTVGGENLADRAQAAGGVGQSAHSGGWGPLAQPAIDTFKAGGASDAFIHGAMANGLGEGGFKEPWQQSWINDQGKREESYGHWQFHKGGELEGYLDKEGKTNPQDTAAQAKFLMRRMEELHPGITKTGDAKAATDAIATEFEKYKGAAAGQRYGQLAEAQKQMGAGGAPAAPGATPVPPVTSVPGGTQGIVPGRAPAAAAPGTGAQIESAGGDSISVQQANSPGVAVTVDKSPANTAIGPGTSRVGDSPRYVRDRLVALPPGSLTGNFLLSTGASNTIDPKTKIANLNAFDPIAAQIPAAKKAGAAAVFIPGVGPGVTNQAEANAKLKQIADANGAIFFEPKIKWQSDGIHPANHKDMRSAANAAVAAQSQAGSSTPPAASPPLMVPEGTTIDGPGGVKLVNTNGQWIDVKTGKPYEQPSQ